MSIFKLQFHGHGNLKPVIIIIIIIIIIMYAVQQIRQHIYKCENL